MKYDFLDDLIDLTGGDMDKMEQKDIEGKFGKRYGLYAIGSKVVIDGIEFYRSEHTLDISVGGECIGYYSNYDGLKSYDTELAKKNKDKVMEILGIA